MDKKKISETKNLYSLKRKETLFFEVNLIFSASKILETISFEEECKKAIKENIVKCMGKSNLVNLKTLKVTFKNIIERNR